MALFKKQKMTPELKKKNRRNAKMLIILGVIFLITPLLPLGVINILVGIALYKKSK